MVSVKLRSIIAYLQIFLKILGKAYTEHPTHGPIHFMYVYMYVSYVLLKCTPHRSPVVTTWENRELPSCTYNPVHRRHKPWLIMVCTILTGLQIRPIKTDHPSMSLLLSFVIRIYLLKMHFVIFAITKRMVFILSIWINMHLEIPTPTRLIAAVLELLHS